MRCLLISSVVPPDPDNGDAQYTRDLLRQPPEGVEYVTYTAALATGELEAGPSLRRPGSLGSVGDLAGALARAAVGRTRAAGLLLRDHVRWFRIQGAFDVVHVHSMPVRFVGPTPPVVVTDSAGGFWYWTAARGLSPATVRRRLRRERRIASLLGYIHPSANPDAAARVLLWVDAGRALQAEVGVPGEAMLVAPPGVPSARRTGRRDGRTLLFVARDFAIKGGDDAVEILRRVRRQVPDARLVVAGASGPALSEPGVEWLGVLDRDTLYEHVYPDADAFVYPTRFDTTGLVVMEALANGVPPVVPRAFAFPEIVRDGVSGFLFEPGDLDTATGHVLDLLRDEDRQAAVSAAARNDFERRFSAQARNDALLRAYVEASACRTSPLAPR